MALIRINEPLYPSEKKKLYKEFWSEMFPVCATVVEASFMDGQHAMRNPTTASVKERIEVCKSLVEEMRQTYHWSKQRITDNLALCLRTKLSGLVVDLDSIAKRSSW